jgi:hypothetical protein
VKGRAIRLELPGGGSAILCGVRGPRPPRCSLMLPPHPSLRPREAGRCPFDAVALCDYPAGRGRTCSAKICGAHATKVGQRDYCPTHAGRVLQLPGIE